MAMILTHDEYLTLSGDAKRYREQRDQLREALEDAVSEVEVMKNEIGYRAATIDVIADCRAALKATEEG